MQRFINENNAKACMSKNHTKGVHSSLKSDKLVYLIFSSTHCPVFSLLLQSCYVLLWENVFVYLYFFAFFIYLFLILSLFNLLQVVPTPLCVSFFC